MIKPGKQKQPHLNESPDLPSQWFFFSYQLFPNNVPVDRRCDAKLDGGISFKITNTGIRGLRTTIGKKIVDEQNSNKEKTYAYNRSAMLSFSNKIYMWEN